MKKKFVILGRLSIIAALVGIFTPTGSAAMTHTSTPPSTAINAVNWEKIPLVNYIFLTQTQAQFFCAELKKLYPALQHITARAVADFYQTTADFYLTDNERPSLKELLIHFNVPSIPWSVVKKALDKTLDHFPLFTHSFQCT